MIRRGSRIGTLALVGLLALALWPGVARAQAPAAQDTLQAVIKRGELIVGTFDFFPPWGFRDAQNNIVGMDVDIAKDLAERKFKLLEALAEHVCAVITGDFKAPWVRLSVAKLGHIRNVRKVGVTLERRRDPGE